MSLHKENFKHYTEKNNNLRMSFLFQNCSTLNIDVYKYDQTKLLKTFDLVQLSISIVLSFKLM